jgi:4-hydroxy-2-oxoheptanedioate aldolase
LAKGEIAIGAALNFHAPPLVELMGALGFDWVFIDCEHGSMNESEVEHLVRAAEAFDITPLARVEANSAPRILRLLDRGVMGIIVPHVATREDAEAIVNACKYYPDGGRSSAANYRTNNYGVGRTIRQFYDDANREIMVIALVESVEGVENIGSIVSVKGLDATFVGPADLAQSMGMPSQDKVDKAIEKIVDTTLKAGKATGTAISATNYPRFEHFIKRGANLVMASITDLVQASAIEFKQRIQAFKPGR